MSLEPGSPSQRCNAALLLASPHGLFEELYSHSVFAAATSTPLKEVSNDGGGKKPIQHIVN